jgi:DNA-3-methyladenine glycosylase II
MDDYEIQLQTAATWLSQHDSVLAPVIAAHGLPTIKPHNDYYGALVNAIIGQQLSVKAAASIKRRFCDLFGGVLPGPAAIIQKTHDELRSAGLSNAKAHYIRDLAQHVIDGRISFEQIAAQSSAELIAELTDVKGIGEWTVHMFLLFCVGRLDVLATGDLGIRNAIRSLYGYPDAPTPLQVSDVSAENNWHPYESIACWYLWRSLDNAAN